MTSHRSSASPSPLPVSSLIARARNSAEERPRFTASPEHQRQLAERFLAASRRGDLQALTEALAADVTAWVDGGPKRTKANRYPIIGSAAVARWLVAVMAGGFPDTRASTADVNGGVALLLWAGDELAGAATIDVVAERIQALRLVVNPDKLAYLQRRLNVPGTAFF